VGQGILLRHGGERDGGNDQTIHREPRSNGEGFLQNRRLSFSHDSACFSKRSFRGTNPLFRLSAGAHLCANPPTLVGGSLAKKEDFAKVPKWRIAYWLKNDKVFESSLIESLFVSAGRNKTHNNEIFVRMWWECNQRVNYWLPYANGGASRKWYGNKMNVVNWSDSAKNEYAKHGGLIPQKSCDNLGVTWNGVVGNNNAFRVKDSGMSLSSSAPTIISDKKSLVYQALGFLNSKTSDYLIKVMNPTLQLNVGEVLELPLNIENEENANVEMLVIQNIGISRTDWDSYENSWDFQRHPLISPLFKGGVREADGGLSLPRDKNLKEHSRDLRTNATRQENHLWYDFLRGFRPRFTRQRIIGEYIADFFCYKAKLVVELDGSQHYTEEGIAYDNERTAYLNGLGIEILRFANQVVDMNFQGVCNEIARVVAEKQTPAACGGTPFEKGAWTFSAAFAAWEREAAERFDTLKANEEELNRIFIGIYGLQDELTPEVEDKDVTVRRADLGRDIRSFISYAVGCMFGRYSLDEPGLVFAGGKFDMARYKTYMPENDNILPIGSADYFDDDIVVRFTQFVRKVYGDGTLGENLNFIADALYPNGSGTVQERIRRYFLNDFYKDHVKVYQKRPIYWLFDSGKKDGFKALFYLHRYDKYTVARARTDYLHPLQRKYESEIKRLDMLSDATDNAREKAAYRKEVDVLLTKIDECRIYDQVVSHIAHQQTDLDLDDGVKVNYEKFQGVEVPVDGGKAVTMDFLAKI
jgi:very-short-patch-repair endonuclease